MDESSMTARASDGAEHADLAQRSVDTLFAVGPPRGFANSHPEGSRDEEVFCYWWLAHLLDCRVDAYERTGHAARLEEAQSVRRLIVERNGGDLTNDYFDDMLWFVLALQRLERATGDASAQDDALSLYRHVVEHGWNDTLGWSLSWRKQQPGYKNSPANGPLVIASLRFAERFPDEAEEFVGYARTAFDWWERTLVGAGGFVEDGINREGDGRIDTEWRFTYNQGLYVGACVEWYRRTGEHAYIERALRCAHTAIRELSDGCVFRGEDGGGDEGLFRGIFYRYLGQLVPQLESGGSDRDELERFIRCGTDALVESAEQGGVLRAGDDWRRREDGPISLSTQLSAVMALEVRRAVEAATGPVDRWSPHPSV